MDTNDLLSCVLQVVARVAIPADRVREIVGSGKKQVQAFNLCDGTRTQTEIAKKCKLDAGNFSRTVARWRQHGVVFAVGEGDDTTLLHVYPIAPAERRRGGGE